MTVYAFADVGREGLGNRLFPWARAEVFASRYNVPIIAPRWFQPRLGPLVRREKDLRYYTGLFDNARGGYIRGVRRALLLNRAHRVPQASADQFMNSPEAKAGTHIVEFEGWQGWFDGVLPYRELIARRLNAILSASTREKLEQSTEACDIAVHVRRGDKAPIAFGQALSGVSTETMSDQWYINAIRSVWEIWGGGIGGRQASVRVFSDAKGGQIDAILNEPGVKRAPDNPSIVDILLLSQAKVLITTGGSSFSAWASFLGAMPTIWYPGSNLPLIVGKPELSIEADLQGRLDPLGAQTIATGLRRA